jgi:glycosyltransferase involved in cell wall biosynthesis
MKIGVDLTAVRSPLSGLGYYSLGLLGPMIQQRPQDTWLLYAYEMTRELEELASFKNVLPVIAQPTSLPWCGHLQRQIKMRCHFLRPVDLFWSLTQWFPRIRFAKRTVVTVYDFFHFLCPEDVAKPQLRRLLRHGARSIAQADAVVAISHGTRKLIEQFHGVSTHQVIWPPVRPIFCPRSQAELAPFLSERQLPYRGYALTVANVEPRKNLDTLLTAYLAALEQFGPDACIPLVFIGKTELRSQPILEKLRSARDRYPHHIHLAGRANDEEMVAYLAGARALFLVSRYEGYGMPIAEARSCATPVVCCDIPEMREAAQDNGMFLPVNELQQRLPPLFLRDSPPLAVGPVTYPSAQELALKMGQVFDSLF